MSMKGWFYAQMEGIVQALEQLGTDDFIFWYEATTPIATAPGLPTIDLTKKYGEDRVRYSGLDEMWYAGATLGAALVGSIAIDWHDMYMANPYPFEIVSQHAAKLHHMTGGQATIPAVWVIHISGQGPGLAGQHSDYEADSWYAHVPGVRTVIPSTVYDAKGLMITAVKSKDPFVYLNGSAFRALSDDIPDTPYEVPIGKAAVRTRGSDLTIVSSGQGMLAAMEGAQKLQGDGISVETIDLRCLNPMDTETLVKSAKKTGRVLTVDQSKYTLCPGAEVIARIAEFTDGVKFKRIAFPDAPPPGAPEMFNYMKPNGTHVYEAAKALLRK
ncbi:MAG: transketolase [Spirochaetes bacterium]|nr:MAG: transketolase [Spirochaetota bacterium]